MQDAVLADLVIPDGQLPHQWRDAVAVIARRTRDVLLAHPWSLASLNDAQFGPNAMRHIEQSLAALDALDVRVDEKLSLWGIVDDYVFGSAIHTDESLARAAAAQRDPTLVADAITFGEQQLATGQFPRLAALYQQSEADHATFADGTGTTGPAMTEDLLAAQFEHGLEALLDGLAPPARAIGENRPPGRRNSSDRARVDVIFAVARLHNT